MKRVGTALLVGLVVCSAVAAAWIDSQFEEADAQEVASLAGHLGARSLLAVFAHPDDEILAAGSLAEAASRDGTVVRMITATRGDAGLLLLPAGIDWLPSVSTAEVEHRTTRTV